MVVVGEEEEKSRWWWLESHKTSKHSQWLHSTLAQLDAKTKAMLKLIDGNADSFAQRAETYYKKRPELICFLQDFYRAHRSLAERFDHLKSSSDHASRSSKPHLDSVCGTTSDADSEIEDPEEEDQDGAFEQERLKLIQESHALRQQLLDKDEEKREVIRQLARTVETLKDENLNLKRRLAVSLKKRSVFDLKPIDKFLGKLFYIMCDGNKSTLFSCSSTS